MRLDATPSLHPLARRRGTLVAEEVPPVSMARTTRSGRGDGHLIEVPSGAQARLRPRPIPADGSPRHHIIHIGAGARVDLLLDDPLDVPAMARSTEIWVGASARLRIVDRGCARNSTVDLVGIQLGAGAVVEFIGMRSGVSQSAVVATDLGPGARASITWLQNAARPESVDVRVKGMGTEARHTLMLSAPLPAGARAIRLDVAADRGGVPTCDAIHLGAPAAPNHSAWTAALETIGITALDGTVELPALPPSLRPALERRSRLTPRPD